MISIRVTRDLVSPMLRRQARQLQQLPQQSYDVWRSVTPIRTGNARRRTTLRGDTIRADYPYAERLDDGYSRQAPRGMFRPTFEWVRLRLRRIFGV